MATHHWPGGGHTAGCAGHGGADDVEVSVRLHPDRGEVDVVVADRGQGGMPQAGPGDAAGHASAGSWCAGSSTTPVGVPG